MSVFQLNQQTLNEPVHKKEVIGNSLKCIALESLQVSRTILQLQGHARELKAYKSCREQLQFLKTVKANLKRSFIKAWLFSYHRRQTPLISSFCLNRCYMLGKQLNFKCRKLLYKGKILTGGQKQKVKFRKKNLTSSEIFQAV